ncbi:hypothetical protein SAMN05216344_101138 [Polaromonas sp. OV174]|uniref:hypothetical protein n=1 Tax=Polaromonas sp. OV174 TaxID=1855300 RepID=UPI0008E3B572|nr:hypothetical protein [Polaromonas sp. OV174]SFB67883.1 hypothetical protein SAMN05216344_101138 [Polaromonas sp. OV174]
MKTAVIRSAWAFMVAGAMLMGSAQAKSAPDAGDKPASGKAKKKAAKSATAAQGGKVKFLPGSGETAKERSTRLQRECKGRVNAGACEGYTH